MSSEIRNLLAKTADIRKTLTGNWEPFNVKLTKDIDFGVCYSLSFECESTANFYVQARFNYVSADGTHKSLSNTPNSNVSAGTNHVTLLIKAPRKPDDFGRAYLMIQSEAISDDGAQLTVSRPMLVEGTAPAAWAPAEGESLAGGGALMSANLLEGVTPNHGNCPLADGVLTSVVIDSSWYDVGTWPLSLDAVAENQTLHLGASVRWHGEAAKAGTAYMSVKYANAAGHINSINVALDGIAAEWRRISAKVVLPSGMRVVDFHTSAENLDAAYDLTAPTLSYGSPVTLASDAHTPYATQDHVAAEYATKAALKVTSDAVTAEVEERGKLAGRVGTLESTSGTHTSRLAQLAASITSLVKGESTYTDPDGASATSGIYSLVTQTRDSVTALFGQYTKTEDLASAAAVRDAKQAGTDAASAASAAQSTADAANTAASKAQSTADGAKSTADGLATMIRQDADGITVGKSEDGETWSTGRTRMTDSAFQVLDKAGTVVTQMAKDGASFLAGLIKIAVGTGTLPGNKTTEYISVDAGSGVAGLSGIISRLDAAIDGVTSSLSAGWEQDFGYGVTAIVRESSTVASSAYLAKDKAELHVGDNSMKVTGDSFSLSHPEYLRKGLRISQGSKVCTGHGTPWVTLFESWDEFQSATGCYDSGTPTLVTMNGDMSAFDGTLSGCEIKAGDAVYVMAQTQNGIPNISSTQSLRIDWICIW